MSKSNKDYSDYIQHLSTVSNSQSLLTGFAFTAITVLLTLLPDPSLFLSQVTLFLLVLLLNLMYLLTLWTDKQSILLCRNLPKPTREISVYNLSVMISTTLFAMTVLFMFLLCNLIYLALASFVVDALFGVFSYLFVWKPLFEYRKALSSQK